MNKDGSLYLALLEQDRLRKWAIIEWWQGKWVFHISHDSIGKANILTYGRVADAVLALELEWR